MGKMGIVFFVFIYIEQSYQQHLLHSIHQNLHINHITMTPYSTYVTTIYKI